MLRLRSELTADAAFEPSLKARAEQLTAFQHRGFARVRGVSRLPAPDGRLAVVSDAVAGWRLSEVLQAAEQEGHQIHTSTVLFLLRQVASAVSALQAVAPGMAHGALGPERLILSAGGRLQVVEYVLAGALAHLPPLPADRLWKDLRIAASGDAADQRFTPQTDVLQLGLIALSLVHNRLLRRDEFPGRLGELLDTATESRVTGERQPIGASLRRWLERALGLTAGEAPWTMEDAQRGLDWISSKEGGYFSTPVGLEPLLQSVERFFTVPPATDGAAPAAPAAPAETPGVQEDDSRGVAPAEPAVVPTVPAPAAAAREDDSTPPVPEEEPGRTAPARVLQLVKPVEDEVRDQITPEPSAFAVATPVAEGVAEHQAADAPASKPPDAKPADASPVAFEAPAPPVTPPLRPVAAVRPAILQDAAPVEVGPVADMLSVERPAGRRRAGWNNEAWTSRSGERPAGTVRATPSAPVTATRLSGSASAATAVALRSEEATLRSAEAVGTVEETLPARPEPSSRLDSTVRRTVASHADASPRVEPPARSERPAAAAAREDGPHPGTRSLFGVSEDTASGEQHPDQDEAPTSGGKAKWLAVAAVVILCGGGFAAWTALTPAGTSTPATQSGDAKSSAAAPAPATQAAAPATSAASQPAGRETAAVPEPAAPAPADTAAVALGSVQILSPFVVAVSEKGESIGTSAAPVSLTAGRHVLTVANDEVGYRASQVVDVRPGRVSRVALALPRGSLNINATPWAEVLVDGQRIGETPLGNVALTVGAHEVRFRHPQLGEQVRSVVVKTGAAGRLSVDMKQ